MYLIVMNRVDCLHDFGSTMMPIFFRKLNKKIFFLHQLIVFLSFLALFSVSCAENSIPGDDLGVIVYDKGPTKKQGMDIPSIEGMQFEVQGPYCVLAGYTTVISPANPDPGDPLGHVTVGAYDMLQHLLAQTVSDDNGHFVMAVPIPDNGTRGYVQVKKEGFPIIRQFDRPLETNWTNMRLHMTRDLMYETPRKILKQQDNRGYIQGSVYMLKSEDQIPGVSVKASSGRVAYLQNGAIPTYDLTRTGKHGVFFVANTDIGPVTLDIFYKDKKVASMTVLTWPDKVLTQVGVPLPDALFQKK